MYRCRSRSGGIEFVYECEVRWRSSKGDVTGNEIVENDDAVVMRCQISISITKIEWRGSRIEKDT